MNQIGKLRYFVRTYIVLKPENVLRHGREK